MALTKKDGIYYYDFKFRGKRHQGSTFLKNKDKARQVEAKVRTDAALALKGIAPPKIAPTFKEFAEADFTSHVERHNKPRTVKFYAEKIRRLLEFPPLAECRLDVLNERLIEKYKEIRAGQKRRSRGKGMVGPGAINAELRTLRKALHLAYTYQLISRMPAITVLPGEITRDYVLDGETEKRYLALAVYPLKEAAILMLDLGLRPHELVRLYKTDISKGRVLVRPDFEDDTAKTGAREIPIPPRSLEVLAFLFELWPDSEWIFPGQRKGTHLTVWALDNLHYDLRNNSSFPKTFVIYSFRHTFGTRLAESGAKPWTIKKVMGHASIKTSEKYIHVSEESVDLDMRRKVLFDDAVRGELPKVPTILADCDKIRL